MKYASRLATATALVFLAGTGLALAAGGGNGSATKSGASTKSGAKTSSKTVSQPKPLGVFHDWTAATYGSGADKTCYAFAMSQKAENKNASAGNGKKTTQKSGMLTVAQRAKYRDEVSVSQGIKYTKGAKVEMTVGSTKLAFFTHDDMAYAMKGKKVVKAFMSGDKAVVKASAPHAKPVVDTFGLQGFSDAYKAIDKACPAKSNDSKASSSSK